MSLRPPLHELPTLTEVIALSQRPEPRAEVQPAPDAGDTAVSDDPAETAETADLASAIPLAPGLPSLPDAAGEDAPQAQAAHSEAPIAAPAQPAAGAVADPAVMPVIPPAVTPEDTQQRLLMVTSEQAPPASDGDLLDDWARTAWFEQAEHDLVRRVLGDVQRQVDHLFEYRVREALGPLLAQVADTLVRETRAELVPLIRDVVRRAVAQELSRHRPR